MDADGNEPISGHDSASLEDLERFVQSLLVTTEAQNRIHAKTQDDRLRLIRAFGLNKSPSMQKRAQRLSECCKWPLAYVRAEGRVGMSLQRCRDRLCPVCSRIRGSELRARIKDAVQRMDDKRFVTLTIQNAGRKLTEDVDHLVNSFKELRRSEFWKNHCVGGLWTMEVTQGKTEGTWHAHLHLLVDGNYMDQAALSDAWLRATGDSRIVWITAVGSTNQAIAYITKYIAKPGEFAKFTEEELCDYAAAMKGRRMFGTFGKLHASISKDRKQEETNADTSTGTTVSFASISHAANAGCEYARTAIGLLQRCGGFYALASGGSWTPAGPPLTEKDHKQLASAIVYVAAQIQAVKDAEREYDERIRAEHAAKKLPPPPPRSPVPLQILIDDWIQRGVWSKRA